MSGILQHFASQVEHTSPGIIIAWCMSHFNYVYSLFSYAIATSCPQSWIEDEESRHLQISYRMDIVRRNRLHGKTVGNARLDTHGLADKVS